MKKTFIKLGVMAIVFVIALFISNGLLNRGNTDMTAQMSPASLPIVYMNVNDEYINPLHGYTVEMEGNYLRGSITPLMANRSISFKAKLYDAVIAKVSYEVRPLDMSRLIEDTDVPDFKYQNNEIDATITLKDLIDDDTEYLLIIKLTTSSGNVIRYYNRVINRAELSIGDKIGFVRDFSNKTFDKEEAQELKVYMESNSEGDNSSYGYVNIHSSFNQLTWGDLNPKLATDKSMEILEIDEKTASIKLTYQVEIMSEIHNVTEFFRIQRGKERMHLMEYERKTSQVFDEEKNVIVNGKILHGIINENIKRIENDNGTIYAFVQQNALYAYNVTNNTLSRLFSFADKENSDERTKYNGHKVKPLKIDGVGNIRFIVYGYMNRGRHEGEVGVALYYYDCSLNTIEEELFIPYAKSYQILETDVEKLSYVSSRGVFYILLDGTVYSINISGRQTKVMQSNISENAIFSSDNENIIAWRMGNKVTDYKEISLYRLDNMSTSSIKAGAQEIVLPLGFMNNDLIYGAAKISDITTDVTGRTIIPMYSIKIQNESGNLLKEYKQSGIYILDANKVDNMIVLSRAIKDEETGGLVEIESDQIVNNKVEATLKNKMGNVVTEDTETTYQSILYKQPPESTLKLTNPKEVVYEGSREIALEEDNNLVNYYVYARGDLEGIYTDAADCVNDAQEQYGIVVNEKMYYIWETENRKSSARIDTLGIDDTKPTPVNTEEENPEETEEEVEIADSRQTYSKCLDIMLKSQGVYVDSSSMLMRMSVTDVLSQNVPKDTDVLELTGCNLDAVLYYVSRGYPVMALTGRGNAVLIIGYDTKNTIQYDPVTNQVQKMGLMDSAALFESNGNRFITYIK